MTAGRINKWCFVRVPLTDNYNYQIIIIIMCVSFLTFFFTKKCFKLSKKKKLNLKKKKKQKPHVFGRKVATTGERGNQVGGRGGTKMKKNEET